jgi:hypothetical protein
MSTLDEWTAEVCGALGLAPEVMDTKAVLDVARDVAHGVARPAAPLTAYLVGVAVGQGAEPATAAATVTRMVADWSASHPQQNQD